MRTFLCSRSIIHVDYVEIANNFGAFFNGYLRILRASCVSTETSMKATEKGISWKAVHARCERDRNITIT